MAAGYKKIYASAARTADPSPPDLSGDGYTGVIVVIDVSAIVTAPSVVFTIEGYDPVSGKYFTVLASAAKTGVGTTVLRVYPGLTPAANLTASDVLPNRWRLKAAHANGNSITYSASAQLIE